MADAGVVRSHVFALWLAADDVGDQPRAVSGRQAAVSDVQAIAREHPDFAVVTAVRAGDRQIFDAMVAQYGADLLRLAFAIGGRMTEAEDAAQDVFLWLWDHRATWTPRAGVRAYLLRAVANRARDLAKARHNHDRLERAYLSVDTGSSVHEVIMAADTDAALWRAIGTLPDRWREVIMLRYVEGLPFADVGITLGISADAAKKLVRRALHALHRILHETVEPSEGTAS